MPIGGVQRTFGLSGSGIDVDAEVQKLMKAKQASYDAVWQKKTRTEWQKTAYNTIYNLTSDFRNNTLAEFRKSATLAPKLVTSNNDAVVSATANADASNVSHTLAVTQLAKGVTLASSDKVTTGSTTYPTSLIKQFGMNDGDTIDFTINGKEINLTVGTSTSINDVVNAINNSGAGVKAAYDAGIDRFFLYSDSIGSTSKIDFTGTASGSFLDKLKISTTNSAPAAGDTGSVFRGDDAKVILDGVEVTQSKNTFAVANVTYTIKAVSPVDALSKPIATTITVAPDIEKTIANVKAFVDDYNTYLSAINKEYTAVYDRNYLPLTDDQKSQMKDNDITKWETKAKTGLLHSDPILGNILEKIRASFIEPVKGIVSQFNNAAAIGIGTNKFFNADGTLDTSQIENGGKLRVDEDALRSALQGNPQKKIVADPDIVYKIFGNSSKDNSSQGIANRLYNQLDSEHILKDLKNKAGVPDAIDSTSVMYKQIQDYNKRLGDMQTMLKNQEDAYYRQFTAMEQAMSRMNQQMSWLSQQMSQ